eukprot:GHVT01032465.1.p1 GENE.GHVT01032465.1~~GHVT01032465.1.p1  ORF type:complete len:952 (+),score=141.22 GHVT01032465.1:804-3659(+)
MGVASVMRSMVFQPPDPPTYTIPEQLLLPCRSSSCVACSAFLPPNHCPPGGVSKAEQLATLCVARAATCLPSPPDRDKPHHVDARLQSQELKGNRLTQCSAGTLKPISPNRKDHGSQELVRGKSPVGLRGKSSSAKLDRRPSQPPRSVDTARSSSGTSSADTAFFAPSYAVSSPTEVDSVLGGGVKPSDGSCSVPTPSSKRRAWAPAYCITGVRNDTITFRIITRMGTFIHAVLIDERPGAISLAEAFAQQLVIPQRVLERSLKFLQLHSCASPRLRQQVEREPAAVQPGPTNRSRWPDQKAAGVATPVGHRLNQNSSMSQSKRELRGEQDHQNVSSRPEGVRLRKTEKCSSNVQAGRNPLTLLYCHANAEDQGIIMPQLRQLSARLQVRLFALDYSGYGPVHHKSCQAASKKGETSKRLSSAGLGANVGQRAREDGNGNKIRTAVLSSARVLALEKTALGCDQREPPIRLGVFEGQDAHGKRATSAAGRVSPTAVANGPVAQSRSSSGAAPRRKESTGGTSNGVMMTCRAPTESKTAAGSAGTDEDILTSSSNCFICESRRSVCGSCSNQTTDSWLKSTLPFSYTASTPGESSPSHGSPPAWGSPAVSCAINGAYPCTSAESLRLAKKAGDTLGSTRRRMDSDTACPGLGPGCASANVFDSFGVTNALKGFKGRVPERVDVPILPARQKLREGNQRPPAHCSSSSSAPTGDIAPDPPPSEEHVNDDVTCAYLFLRSRLKIPAESIIVYGRSLGTGPACYLASQEPLAGVILQSGFTSLIDVGLLGEPSTPPLVGNIRLEVTTKEPEAVIGQSDALDEVVDDESIEPFGCIPFTQACVAPYGLSLFRSASAVRGMLAMDGSGDHSPPVLVPSSSPPLCVPLSTTASRLRLCLKAVGLTRRGGGWPYDMFVNIQKIHKISAPTLFIHGTDDNIVNVGHSMVTHPNTTASRSV